MHAGVHGDARGMGMSVGMGVGISARCGAGRVGGQDAAPERCQQCSAGGLHHLGPGLQTSSSTLQGDMPCTHPHPHTLHAHICARTRTHAHAPCTHTHARIRLKNARMRVASFGGRPQATLPGFAVQPAAPPSPLPLTGRRGKQLKVARLPARGWGRGWGQEHEPTWPC